MHRRAVTVLLEVKPWACVFVVPSIVISLLDLCDLKNSWGLQMQGDGGSLA